ncbi:MAG TPA: type-F conjugative transfer system secretin TraK [Thiobacillaceae bacterium]|nr:type-F conjugative transfer system secretin TraK [Thiobacillaceae bacterium]
MAASLLLLGALTPPAWALQVIPVRDGETAFARIAADDLTRIALSEGRIQSWHALKGRLAIEKNARTGQIYVRPLDRGEPASLFLTADSGATYALTLQPVDMPAESLILKDSARRAAKPSVAEQADPRQRLVKELALMMAADRLPPDMEVRERGESLRLWQGSRFVHLRSWLGAAVVADLFQLTNTGNAELRVAEAELFRAGVLAVGMENHALNPGETTRVFVIRQREGDE